MIYSQTILLLKWLRILFSLKMQGNFMWNEKLYEVNEKGKFMSDFYILA